VSRPEGYLLKYVELLLLPKSTSRDPRVGWLHEIKHRMVCGRSEQEGSLICGGRRGRCERQMAGCGEFMVLLGLSHCPG
jgi:hypothetical protein